MNKDIEKILRFNCPNGCDGNGSYPEMSADGEWEQGQCQWCFEFGMPARKSIEEALRQAVIYGWQASAEGYNNEYTGSLSANGEEVESKLADGYLLYLKGEPKYNERY